MEFVQGIEVQYWDINKSPKEQEKWVTKLQASSQLDYFYLKEKVMTLQIKQLMIMNWFGPSKEEERYLSFNSIIDRD